MPAKPALVAAFVTWMATLGPARGDSYEHCGDALWRRPGTVLIVLCRKHWCVLSDRLVPPQLPSAAEHAMLAAVRREAARRVGRHVDRPWGFSRGVTQTTATRRPPSIPPTGGSTVARVGLQADGSGGRPPATPAPSADGRAHQRSGAACRSCCAPQALVRFVRPSCAAAASRRRRNMPCWRRFAARRRGVSDAMLTVHGVLVAA
jgi:hypothetical protein